MQAHADLSKIAEELPASTLHPLEVAKRIAVIRGICGADQAAIADALSPLYEEIRDFGMNRVASIEFVERFAKHFEFKDLI